ncbi:MAG TPA: SMI1/KNR4 family protein [Pseudohongiella sp.]|nr:SMI1/KNR4 family protein [Pseudohongiella sp.]
MEEVIELLREKNEPVPVPLELPDEDLLVEIEEELLLPIPADLRAYLLYASDVVYGSLEPVTVTDPRSHTYLPEMAAVAWDQGMPRYLLPICQLGNGYYCIGEHGDVHYWDGEDLGEDPQGNEEWTSLWEWIREVWLQE